MLLNVSFQQVQIATGSPDQDGYLVMASGFLVAVLVRLSEQHGQAGKLFLEAGFDHLGAYRDLTFTDLNEASHWFSEHLTLMDQLHRSAVSPRS